MVSDGRVSPFVPFDTDGNELLNKCSQFKR